MTASPDRIDRLILELLRRDGRMAHAAIAKEVGLSGPAVHERVKKLEQRGVIAGYSAILDPEKLGREHVAFCMITLSEANDSIIRAVGFVAVVFGAANVVGGFWVTNRMLGMFRPPAPKVKKREG